MPENGDYVQVVVRGVVHTGPETVVQLVDEQERVLNIVVGPCEALAIAHYLVEAREQAPRPTTQDLALAVLGGLGARLDTLYIDDFWEGPSDNGVYYGRLSLARASEAESAEPLRVDCRPSDGLALALAERVPVLVAESIMSELGQAENDA